MEALEPGHILGKTGRGLTRPECVLAHESGLLFAPDWSGSGGVSVIARDGSVHTIQAAPRDPSTPRILRPNGIALEAGGSLLLAHLGESAGGVFRLFPDGEVAAAVLTVDGIPLPPTNFVVADALDRLWITVSTTLTPRADDYRATAATGFIALAQPGETDATTVARGLGYANECVVDRQRMTVYVNETFARRLTRFTLLADGTLTDPHVLAHFGEGTYPDGLALDIEGGLIVTSIISNRLLRVTPDGAVTTLLEDSVPEHLLWTEAAYQSHALGRAHLDTARSKHLKNISNLAFGGADMRTAWLGNLLGDSIPWTRLDVPGEEMPHYRVPLGPLEALTAGT